MRSAVVAMRMYSKGVEVVAREAHAQLCKQFENRAKEIAAVAQTEILKAATVGVTVLAHSDQF